MMRSVKQSHDEGRIAKRDVKQRRNDVIRDVKACGKRRMRFVMNGGVMVVDAHAAILDAHVEKGADQKCQMT